MKLEVKDGEVACYKPSKKVVDLLVGYAAILREDTNLYHEIEEFYKDRGYLQMYSFAYDLGIYLCGMHNEFRRHLETFDITLPVISEKTDETYESEMDAFEVMYDLEQDRISALNDILLAISEEKDLVHMFFIQDILKHHFHVCRQLSLAYKIMKRDGDLALKGKDINERIKF